MASFSIRKTGPPYCVHLQCMLLLLLYNGPPHCVQCILLLLLYNLPTLLYCTLLLLLYNGHDNGGEIKYIVPDMGVVVAKTVIHTISYHC